MRAVVPGAFNRLMISGYFSNTGVLSKMIFGQILELLLSFVNEEIRCSDDRMQLLIFALCL